MPITSLKNGNYNQVPLMLGSTRDELKLFVAMSKMTYRTTRNSTIKKYLRKTDENSFMFVLYMRLIPVIPYELQNYIIGLVEISTPRFILATFIGLLPGTFFIMYLGNTLTDVQPIKVVILAIISVFALLLPIVLKRFTKAKKVLQIENDKN